MPDGAGEAREAGGLPAAQLGADLDEMHLGGADEAGVDAAGPEQVGHQRAASGAEFDQRQARRTAERLVGGDAPDADQLAEHLADFRRSDEIALEADGGAGGVIAMVRIGQDEAHVVGDRNGTDGADQPDDLVFERRHDDGSGRRVRPPSARAISAAAAMAVTIDRSMPMVRKPPARKPTCGSGSRTVSTRMRAAA